MSEAALFPWVFPITWEGVTVADSMVASRMAFYGSPFAIGPAFSTLPGLMSMSIRRGRNHHLDRFETGTATITLSNLDGRYWPNNPTGPYYGTLVPGRPINIRATYGATDYDLFTGYIEAYRPGWVMSPMKAPVMVLQCADMTKAFNRTTLNSGTVSWYPSAWANIAGTRVWQVIQNVLEDVNKTSDAILYLELAQSFTTYPFPANQLSLWQVTAPRSGTVDELIIRTNLSTPGNFANATFALYANNAGEPGAFIAESEEAELTQEYTHVVFPSTAITAGTVYWIAQVLNNTADIYVSTQKPTERYKTFTYGTAFPDPAGAGYTAAARGMPSIFFGISQHDIDTGQSKIVAVDSIDRTQLGQYLTSVGDAEGGQFYIAGNGRVQFEDRDHRVTGAHLVSQATFGTGALEMHYRMLDLSLDDDYLFNEIRLQSTIGLEQVSYDQTSINKYGRRTYLAATLLNNSDADVASRAAWLLSRYKDPAMRLSAITILPDSNPVDLYPKALGYEISDRITVKLDEAGLDDEFFIEGINHDWKAGGAWETRWQLSPAWDTSY